jgi:hypothetical protein
MRPKPPPAQSGCRGSPPRVQAMPHCSFFSFVQRPTPFTTPPPSPGKRPGQIHLPSLGSRGSSRECLCWLVACWLNGRWEALANLRRDTIGSPARGHGSNWRLKIGSAKRRGRKTERTKCGCAKPTMCTSDARQSPLSPPGCRTYSSSWGLKQISAAAGIFKMTFSLTREDGHNVPILRPVITLHDQLMSSRNQRQPIVVVERLGDVLAKCVPSSSRGDPPSASVVGVGPEEIAHGALVRHLLYAIERSNVIQRVDTG